MAYATPEQLAAALRIGTITPKNQDALTIAVEAAAEEIDAWLARPVDSPLPDPPPYLIVAVNIGRGVEHYKAADAAYGALGFDNTGVATAPRDTFARWAAILIPFQMTYGVA
jgi:hypothetical protein